MDRPPFSATMFPEKPLFRWDYSAHLKVWLLESIVQYSIDIPLNPLVEQCHEPAIWEWFRPPTSMYGDDLGKGFWLF